VATDPGHHPPAPRRPADEQPPADPARANGAGPGHRPDPDEATLVDALARAKAGDETGFVTLYRAMAPRLHRYATALVGGDADDATAEAWLQIARDVRRFSGDIDGFRGWAARITRNRALDLLRDRGHPPAQDGVEVLARMAGPNDTSSAALDAISTEDALALIATLPTDQAEAVLLRAVVGLDANAAGEVLGKRAGAVRVAAHRGLRRLARQLGERGSDGGFVRAASRSEGARR
jgi:RNA polymerase sigma-70 factor (ECF subfamily)